MWYIILWVGVIVYLNHLASNFAANRAKRIPDQPLPDILHDVCPAWDNHIPDYLLFVCIVYAMLGGSYPSTVDWYNLLTCLTWRPVFICLTTFPTCYASGVEHDEGSLYGRLFLRKHDLMFSGHTCWFVFIGRLIGGVTGGMVQFLFPFSLVCARYHYTLDIIVAMMVYEFVSNF